MTKEEREMQLLETPFFASARNGRTQFTILTTERHSPRVKYLPYLERGL